MRLIDADPFGVIFLQGKSEEFIEGVNFILDKIYEAPTIEEIPHGEWIIRRDKRGKHIYSVCSKCNVPYLETDFPNFCPNCGADNRKRGEAE